MKGIKRLTKRPTRKRLPITPDILLNLKQVWQPSSDSHDTSMLRAAACMCFFWFLSGWQGSNIRCFQVWLLNHPVLRWRRVNSRADPQYLEVHIKAAKTDPFRLGVSVFLGVTASPVSAILNYMVIHGSRPGPFCFLWWNFSNKRAVCWSCAERLGSCRFRLIGIYRAQLPNWYSNHCSQARFPGLLNQDLGSMAECGLLSVHPDSKDHTVLSGKNPSWAIMTLSISCYHVSFIIAIMYCHLIMLMVLQVQG